MVEPRRISDEFDGCELGDERLVARVARLAEMLERDPAQSLPLLLQRPADLEAAYRFLNNERVTLADVLSGHLACTLERAAQHPVCLAIHDSTDFQFSGVRRGLGIVDRRQQGFYAHACLAVAPGAVNEPLGLLALDTWARKAKKGKRTSAERLREVGLESERWLRQSLEVEANMPRGTKFIHIEDREGDIYRSLDRRAEEGMAYVVRANNTRVVLKDEATENVLTHMREQPRAFSRVVALSARRPPMALRKAGTPRSERTAVLAFASNPVKLCRPCRARTGSPFLEVNVVHVIETGEVPQGDQRVEWLLYTTESIATQADVECVVDYYRARWMIEEYFKALKTGCNYEQRQLESGDALLRALGVFAVIASRMLMLRHLERCEPTAAATSFATPEELAVLRAKRVLTREATIAEFLAAVARLGGHIKNNGRPGLLVLWRGFNKLRDLAAGWALAQRSDQS